MTESTLELEFCCTCLKVCMRKDDTIALNLLTENVSYKEKLKSCVPEMFLENKENYVLCTSCTAALDTAYTFRSMCLETQHKLQGYCVSKSGKLPKEEVVKLLWKNSESDLSLSTLLECNRYIKEEVVEVTENSLELESNLSTEHVWQEESPIENNNKLVSIKEEVQNIETTIKTTPVKIAQERLTDLEIIAHACQTIPELKDCTVESLMCRVAVEKLPNVISLSQKPSNKHKRKKAESYFWCNFCKKYLKTRKDRYNGHILRHKNIRAYKCKCCPAAFFTQDSLYLHVRRCAKANNKVENDNGLSFVFSLKKENQPVTSNSFMVKTDDLELEDVDVETVDDAELGLELQVGLQTQDVTNEGLGMRSLSSDNTKAHPKREASKSTIYKEDSDSDEGDVASKKRKIRIFGYRSMKRRSKVPVPQPGVKLYHCPDCPSEFTRVDSLKRHVTSHNCNKPRRNRGSKSRKDTSSGSSEMFVETDESTQPRSELVQEDAVVTPIIQNIESLADSSSPTPSNMSKDDKLYMCQWCCKVSFESENLLHLHLKMHRDDFMCVACNKVFPTIEQLQEHKNQYNKMQRKVPAETKVQSKQQATPQVITESAASTSEAPESSERPKSQSSIMVRRNGKYFCTICDMSFSHRDHENTHTKATPYKCKQCGKRFSGCSSLRRHMRNVHMRHVQRQQREAGQVHICEVCNKNFPNEESLYLHVCQTAMGELVFRCQICKNMFVGKPALVEHMAVHISTNN